MQESGDFRLLRNAAIKKSVLRLDRRHKDIALLQKNYLQALDDGYIPPMTNRFDIATMHVTAAERPASSNAIRSSARDVRLP